MKELCVTAVLNQINYIITYILLYISIIYTAILKIIVFL